MEFNEKIRVIRAECKGLGLVFRESNFKINGKNAYEFVKRNGKEPVYQNSFKKCYENLINGNIKRIVEELN